VWTAVGITSWAVSERVLLSSGEAESIRKTLVTLWTRMRDLPPRIQAICNVQFWSWIGWFPFLFYGSTWVGKLPLYSKHNGGSPLLRAQKMRADVIHTGETYFRYEYNEARDGPIDDVLGQVGRLGSTALVLYSFVTFGASLALPNLVQPAESSRGVAKPKFTGRPPSTFVASAQAALKDLAAVRPRLVTAWICSELFFAAVFMCAPFVRSLWFASLTVALAGIPWTVTVWAPLAEMGVEIDRLASGENHGYAGISGMDDHDLEIENELSGSSRLSHDDPIRQLGQDPGSATSGKLSGIYLGVLNAYTTLPQFMGTGISWVVFSIFEPKRSTDQKDSPAYLQKTGPNAIALCLLVGAVSAGVATCMAWKLRRIS
jgi:solute carrier family 45 protein 1/2/4